MNCYLCSMNEYSLPRPIFNVRIYGILIEKGHLLVSDEIHVGRMITKFPGGGLQFGEGTVDGLKREFMEELNLEVKILNHFYTADFFQPSAFDATQQVIGIYYLIESKLAGTITVEENKFTFANENNGAQSFRWVDLNKLFPDEFTFPIDQNVAKMLLTKHQGL